MGVLDPYVANEGDLPPGWLWVPDHRMIPGNVDYDTARLLGCILDLTEEHNGRWICSSDNEPVWERFGKPHRRIFQRYMQALKNCGVIRRVQDDADPWNGRIEVLWRPPDEMRVDSQSA